MVSLICSSAKTVSFEAITTDDSGNVSFVKGFSMILSGLKIGKKIVKSNKDKKKIRREIKKIFTDFLL